MAGDEARFEQVVGQAVGHLLADAGGADDALALEFAATQQHLRITGIIGRGRIEAATAHCQFRFHLRVGAYRIDG